MIYDLNLLVSNFTFEKNKMWKRMMSSVKVSIPKEGRVKLPQSPNLEGTWSQSQNPKHLATTGPRLNKCSSYLYRYWWTLLLILDRYGIYKFWYMDDRYKMLVWFWIDLNRQTGTCNQIHYLLRNWSLKFLLQKYKDVKLLVMEVLILIYLIC